MDNEKDLQDFNLDDIMRQLREISDAESTGEIPAVLTDMDAPAQESESQGTVDADALELAQQAFSQAARQPDAFVPAAAPELNASDPLETFVPEEPALVLDLGPEEPTETAASESTVIEVTLTEDAAPQFSVPEETDAEPFQPEHAFPAEEPEAGADPTIRVDAFQPEEEAYPEVEAQPEEEVYPEAEAQPEEEDVLPNEGPKTIPLDRSAKLRELKRKLVAGPEKRYYSLSELGVGKLQMGLIANFILLLLCGIGVVLYSRGMVPASRTKLMIFSQVLGLMLSGLLGCGLMMDGIGDLFHLRYSMNTSLAITFIACMADAWFCLDEQRVPFCAAFVLEMSMALLANYHKRTTEMAQLDTMRKATSLVSLVKEPQFYEKRAGILRGQGDVEDFMETYSRPSGPELVQRVYAFVALIACIGIAVLTGLLHGTSMAVKIFSTSLLVSLPAGYFVALTRPAALLERRLHMVGAVICGWQGVKKLCGRAVVPLRDKDLFPRGSTKLNGIKFYSDRTPAEVVSYTASLIFAAGGGLVPLFRNLLVSRDGTEYPVENFRDYDRGGIGGEVNGEPVLLGTLEFLEDMGVEIPQGTMVNQAIYVSIDGQLAAVIAISYAKMRSASAGLVSLCGCRKLKTLLLAGDFMMTDSFIRDKFAIRTRRLILPPKEERAELAARKADPESDVLALVTRDDLVSTAYAITGSMSLRTACRLGSLIGIVGGIIGIIIMLALSYLGSEELLTPARVILYQLVWMIPSLLATEWTRVV